MDQDELEEMLGCLMDTVRDYGCYVDRCPGVLAFDVFEDRLSHAVAQVRLDVSK